MYNKAKMNKEKQIEILKEENDKITEELLSYTNYTNRDRFKDLLGELIENELEQEGLCNE